MALIYFIFNPVIGLITSLKNMTKLSEGIVFICFYALFGYAFDFSLQTADCFRIARSFQEYTDQSISEIISLYKNGRVTDIYLYCMFSCIHPITTNPKILYLVFHFIYGFFTYLFIKKFYIINNTNHDKVFYITIFCIIMMHSPVHLSTTRHYTASAIFIYGIIQYFIYNKKAILLIVITPLIHFSFIVSAAAFIVFLLINKFAIPTKLIFYLTVLVFFVSFVNLNNETSTFFSQTEIETDHARINTKINAYENSSENQERNYFKDRERLSSQGRYYEANKLFSNLTQNISKIGAFILLVLLYKDRKILNLNHTQKRLFKYILLTFLLYYSSSIVMSNTSFRFGELANMILIFYLYHCYALYNFSKLKKYIMCLPFIFIYQICFTLFNAPRLVEETFWIFPPILTLINGINFNI